MKNYVSYDISNNPIEQMSQISEYLNSSGFGPVKFYVTCKTYADLIKKCPDFALGLVTADIYLLNDQLALTEYTNPPEPIQKEIAHTDFYNFCGYLTYPAVTSILDGNLKSLYGDSAALIPESDSVKTDQTLFQKFKEFLGL